MRGMLASTTPGADDHSDGHSDRHSDRHSGPARALERAERRARSVDDYGAGLGWISAYEMRCQADCVGLRKNGGLRYLRRES